MISYEPLWETMRQKNITTYKLMKEHSISSHTIDTLKHDGSITMNTLENLCRILECEPQQIVKFVFGEEK